MLANGSGMASRAIACTYLSNMHLAEAFVLVVKLIISYSRSKSFGGVTS
jgi:hypothetical protein